MNRRLILARLLYYTGLVFAAAMLNRVVGRGGPLFVMLHRVIPADAGRHDPVDQMALLSRHAITPRETHWRLAFLKRWVMPCGDPAELSQGIPAHRRFYITFDDGYLDNILHAAPVLERLGMRGVIFIVAALVEQPRAAPWWDRWGSEALDQNADPVTAVRAYNLRCSRTKAVFRGLGADDMALQPTPRYLDRTGLARLPDTFYVANHTAWHANLTQVSGADRLRHIEDGEVPIHDHPRRLPLLAFPFGAYDEALLRELRERGKYAIAFATGAGREGDPICARRLNLNVNGHALFAAQAVGLMR